MSAARDAHALMNEARELWKQTATSEGDRDELWDINDKPTVSLFTSTMDAYSRATRLSEPDCEHCGEVAVKEVMSLFRQMESGSDAAPQPNVWTFTSGEIIAISKKLIASLNASIIHLPYFSHQHINSLRE